MASVVVDDSPSASVGDGVSSAAVESHGELLGNVVVVESSLEKIVDMDVLVLDAAVSVTAVESTTTAVEVVVGVGVAGVVVVVVVVTVVVGSGVPTGVLGAHEITSFPLALTFDEAVPKRMMITSPLATSISAFSLVAVEQPPKLLHVVLATEGALEIVPGQALRY
jgi:hypothetical protein